MERKTRISTRYIEAIEIGKKEGQDAEVEQVEARNVEGRSSTQKRKHKPVVYFGGGDGGPSQESTLAPTTAAYVTHRTILRDQEGTQGRETGQVRGCTEGWLD